MNKRKGDREHEQHVAEQATAYGVTLPVDNPSERFLSPNDIGKILNVTGEAVKQWIYHRRLPAIKLGNGYWKVKVADFESFLKARNDMGRRRVLITGTAKDHTAEIAQAVERVGLQAITAHNYADALLKGMDHYPALFVISLALKDHDPWKLAEKIRATKVMANIPILLIADNDLSDADADKALKLYAQGFLQRPVDVATLTEEIKRIISRTL